MAKEEIEHKKRKYIVFILLALLVAFLAVIMAQNAQDTADINNVFAIVVNNTDLYPGQRTINTVYWANDSPIAVYAIFHAVGTGAPQSFDSNLSINGTVAIDKDFHTSAGAGFHDHWTIYTIVPKGANYSIHNSTNVFNIEWREYPILSGKNGTLSINQSILGNSFNATYDATTIAYNANYSAQTFPNSTIILANDSMNSLKVNKSGDNMTGALNIGNASKATMELITIQNEANSAALRLETNNSRGSTFFGARYNGRRLDNMTPIIKNDVIFLLSGIGTETNNTFSGAAAEIKIVSDENFSATKHPGSIEFWTAANITSGVSSKRWKIETNGSLIPASNNAYEIGNATSKVKNLSIVLTAEGSTLDAVCYDGTKLFYNPGIATCTASRESFKQNITPANYSPLSLQRFQLITYDYVVRYPHVIEQEDTVEYTEKTVKRYGLTAEQVEAIDPLLVARDESGNLTGVHYEDLAAYLLNVTQSQQAKLDKICSNQPSLCQ